MKINAEPKNETYAEPLKREVCYKQNWCIKLRWQFEFGLPGPGGLWCEEYWKPLIYFSSIWQFFKFRIDCSFKEKNVHTTEHSFGTVFEISKGLPCFVGTDYGNVIVNEILLFFQTKIKLKKIICCTSKRALLANKFNKILRDLPKKLLFGKNSGNWLREKMW